MPRTVRQLLATAAVAFSALFIAACPVDIPPVVPDGNWGGEHMGMVVTDTGATIEYDCASGTIDEPLRLDASGAFAWRGTHVIGHGGPIRQDEQPDAHPAEYTGHADSRRMTITVRLTDGTAFTPQTFALTLGTNPRVFKCL
jgi:hypothetical protein